MSRTSLDYTREAPGTVYEGLTIKPISGISSDAPNSSNHVRDLDDLSFILVGEAVECLVVKAAARSSARRERSIFPITVMVPCGLGILSLREA